MIVTLPRYNNLLEFFLLKIVLFFFYSINVDDKILKILKQERMVFSSGLGRTAKNPGISRKNEFTVSREIYKLSRNLPEAYIFLTY